MRQMVATLLLGQIENLMLVSMLALSAVAVYINIIERYRFMLSYISNIEGMECPCRKKAFRRFEIATAEQET